jgi:hypothetical protein
MPSYPPTATEPRCPRCRDRLLRLADGVLTCHAGCTLTEADFGPGLMVVELWFTLQRRRNLRRLVGEKRRRGLPLALSEAECTRAWNAPVAAAGPAVRPRLLDFDTDTGGEG